MEHARMSTKVTMGEVFDDVVLTHTCASLKIGQPMTFVWSLDVVSAGELAAQLNDVIRQIGERRFSRSGVPEKTFDVKTGKSHA